MDNLIVRLAMQTGLIFGAYGRLMLDGLLAGILFERYRNPERALAEVPLARFHDIPCGSQAFCRSPATRFTRQIGYSIKGQMTREPMAHRLSDRRPPVIDSAQGRYQNMQNSYVGVSTPDVYFLGRGDLAVVRDLLSSVQFIGSLRNKGSGEIASVMVEKVPDSNRPDFGIVSAASLLRPVPMWLKDSLPSVEHGQSIETWRNPYRFADLAEPCMVPPEHLRILSQKEIERLALT